MSEYITVEGVSKDGCGIILQDKTWKNGSKWKDPLFMGLTKGTVIDAELDAKGKVISFKVLSSSSPAQSSSNATAPATYSKGGANNPQAARSMAASYVFESSSVAGLIERSEVDYAQGISNLMTVARNLAKWIEHGEDKENA